MVAIGQELVSGVKFACYLEQMGAEREGHWLFPFLDFHNSKEK